MAAPRNTTYELIYHVGRGNIPQTEVPQVLSSIFDAQDYKLSIQKQLSDQDLAMWVEHLDQVYYSLPSFKQLDSSSFSRSSIPPCTLRNFAKELSAP